MYVFVTTQTTKIISGSVSLKPLTVLMLAHTKEKEKKVQFESWLKTIFIQGRRA